VSTAVLRRSQAVDFEWEAPSGVHKRVMTDRAKISLIVRNLVSNAFKFTSEGKVVVRVMVVGDTLMLEVGDTGMGISPEHLPVIFDMFRQADGSATRRHGGVGLGLYIVREFVRRLGGIVDVTSTPGRGSRFRVVLPSACARTRPGRTRRSRAAWPWRGRCGRCGRTCRGEHHASSRRRARNQAAKLSEGLRPSPPPGAARRGPHSPLAALGRARTRGEWRRTVGLRLCGPRRGLHGHDTPALRGAREEVVRRWSGCRLISLCALLLAPFFQLLAPLLFEALPPPFAAAPQLALSFRCMRALYTARLRAARRGASTWPNPPFVSHIVPPSRAHGELRAVTIANFFFFMNFASFFLLPLHVRALGGSEHAIGLVMGTAGMAGLSDHPPTRRACSTASSGARFLLAGIATMGLAALGFLLVDRIGLLLFVLRMSRGSPSRRASTRLDARGRVRAARAARGHVRHLRRVDARTHALAPALGEFLIHLGGFHLLFAAAAVCTTIAFAVAWGLPRVTRRPRRDGGAGCGQHGALLHPPHRRLLRAVVRRSDHLRADLRARRAEAGPVSTFFLSYTGAAVLTRLVGGGLSTVSGGGR
jgi:hypothetical protein